MEPALLAPNNQSIQITQIYSFPPIKRWILTFTGDPRKSFLSANPIYYVSGMLRESKSE